MKKADKLLLAVITLLAAVILSAGVICSLLQKNSDSVTVYVDDDR